MLGIDTQRINDYDWKNRYMITQSQLSSVFQVLHLNTGNYVAIKEYNMFQISHLIKSVIEARFTAVETVTGNCILKVLKTFRFQNFLYIVTELCETNLKKYLTKKQKGLEQKQIGKIGSHIVNGIKSILQKKCLHGNLNPWNIFCNKNVWKLSGFIKPNQNIHKQLSKSQIKLGKFRYIAPQILIQNQYYPTSQSDVWSFGIILYQLVLGQHPFLNADYITYKSEINKNIILSQQNINPKLKYLINSCLKRLPEDRISWDDISKNQFLSSFIQQKIIVHEDKSKDILMILDNLQQAALNQLGSYQVVQNFCEGKLIWNGIKLDQNKLLNQNQFKNLCLTLNSNMDIVDIRLLFRWIDTSQDGFVNQQQFAYFLTSQQFGTVIKNFLQQLSIVIKKTNIDAQQLFRNYDINNSGTLDQSQIRQIVKVLLPNFSNNYLSLIIDHINKRFNGNLPIQTLYQQYKLRYFVDDESDEQKYVKQQLQIFKNQVKQFQITCSQIVKNFDKNKNDKLDFGQFKKLVFSIGQFVRQKQLKMMFDQVDKDHSGHICVRQLEKFFNNK